MASSSRMVVTVACAIAAIAACNDDPSGPKADAGPSEGGLVDAAPTPADAHAGDSSSSEDASSDGSAACTPVLLGNGAGKISFGSDACNACVGQSCCDEFVACYPEKGGTAAQMDCFQLRVCLVNCFAPPDAGSSDAAADTSDASDGAASDGGGLAACIAGCAAAHPSGTPILNGVFACATAHCAADAGGGVCGAGFPTL